MAVGKGEVQTHQDFYGAGADGSGAVGMGDAETEVESILPEVSKLESASVWLRSDLEKHSTSQTWLRVAYCKSSDQVNASKQ